MAAWINPTDLSGLSPILTVGLLVLALVGFIAVILVCLFLLDQEGPFDADEFDVKSVSRGTALACWHDDHALKSVAKQHDIDGMPSKVERKSGLGISVPFGGAKGTAEGSRTITEESFEDYGHLILQLLGDLDDKGVLSRKADCVPIDGARAELALAFSAEREETEEYFRDWLSKRFPEGLERVSLESLVTALADVAEELPEERIRRQLCEIHRRMAKSDSRVEFIEGEWRVLEHGGGRVIISLTTLRLVDPDLLPWDDGSTTAEMPAGASIQVGLNEELLTRHGQNAFIGVTRPVRACVMGTIRQHDPETGRLEIAPIAVFQRVET